MIRKMRSRASSTSSEPSSLVTAGSTVLRPFGLANEGVCPPPGALLQEVWLGSAWGRCMEAPHSPQNRAPGSRAAEQVAHLVPVRFPAWVLTAMQISLLSRRQRIPFDTTGVGLAMPNLKELYKLMSPSVSPLWMKLA